MRGVSTEATWLTLDCGPNRAGVALRLCGAPICLSDCLSVFFPTQAFQLKPSPPIVQVHQLKSLAPSQPGFPLFPGQIPSPGKTAHYTLAHILQPSGSTAPPKAWLVRGRAMRMCPSQPKTVDLTQSTQKQKAPPPSVPNSREDTGGGSLSLLWQSWFANLSLIKQHSSCPQCDVEEIPGLQEQGWDNDNNKSYCSVSPYSGTDYWVLLLIIVSLALPNNPVRHVLWSSHFKGGKKKTWEVKWFAQGHITPRQKSQVCYPWAAEIWALLLVITLCCLPNSLSRPS